MRDGAEARLAATRLGAALSSDVGVIAIVRFRATTLQSIGRAGVEAVTDALLHGDHPTVDSERDQRPPGLALLAVNHAGAPLEQLQIHPAVPDLEGFLAEVALNAAQRVGCQVELRAGQLLLERLTSTRAPIDADATDLEQPFAGLDVKLEREGETLRLQRDKPAARHPALILVVLLLAAAFWWLVLAGLLLRSGRELVFDVARRTFRRRPFRWQATLSSRELMLTDDEAKPLVVPLDRVRAVSLAPPAWTPHEMSQAAVLRLLVDGSFIELPVPAELRSALAEVVRRKRVGASG